MIVIFFGGVWVGEGIINDFLGFFDLGVLVFSFYFMCYVIENDVCSVEVIVIIEVVVFVNVEVCDIFFCVMDEIG